MVDITKLDKEIQDLIISAYLLGVSDGEISAPNAVLKQNKLEYINNVLNPECEITLIDSVS